MMKVYILTSGSKQCIDGVFTSIDLLNKYKKNFPKAELDKNNRYYYPHGCIKPDDNSYLLFDEYYNKPIELECDFFPDNGEEDTYYVKQYYVCGERRFITKKVEFNKSHEINKVLKFNRCIYVYIHEKSHEKAIEKGKILFDEYSRNII